MFTVVVPDNVPVRVEVKAQNGAVSIFGRDASGEDVRYPRAVRYVGLSQPL